MASREISTELEQFIFRFIDSVEQLEVLLFLRNKKEHAWSSARVSQEIRSTPESVTKRMERLVAEDFVINTFDSEILYQYQPKTQKSDELIGELAEAYVSRKMTVINLIFSKPASALMDFANAFKLKKDDDHG